MPTPEFMHVANSVLGEMINNLPPVDRQIAEQVHFEVEQRAMPWQKSATGTPQDYTLLGMYQWEPTPKITIFEESLRKMADKMGGLYQTVKDTLWHEFFQHAMGFDHTKETTNLGYLPAHAVSDYDGSELEQWKLGYHE